MYAIVKTGGKQYKVAEGDLVKIEKIEGEPGSSVALTPVLLVDALPICVVSRLYQRTILPWYRRRRCTMLSVFISNLTYRA